MKLSEWVSKFDLPFMFEFESKILDKTIQWSYTDACQEKQFWETWIPKKSDIQIITRLNKEQKKQVLDELWEDLQSAIQFTRDRNNARRKAKRLAQKEKV